MKKINFALLLEEFNASPTNTVRLLATRTQVVGNIMRIVENGSIYIFCVKPIDTEPHYLLINAADSSDIPFSIKVSDVKSGINAHAVFEDAFLLLESNELVTCVLFNESKEVANMLPILRSIKEQLIKSTNVDTVFKIRTINDWSYTIEIGVMHVPLIANRFPDYVLNEMDDIESTHYQFDIDVELADYDFYHSK